MRERNVKALVIVMLLVVFLTSVFATAVTSYAEDSKQKANENTITVSFNNGTLTVSGTGTIKATDADRWKTNASNITNVIISDGITQIEANTFSSLSALQTVTIGNSVYYIEDGAFPSRSFTMIGNHNPCARYAGNHSNVTLKMNKLRVLAIGNSHTADATAYGNNIISDLGLKDKISITVLGPMGGRKLFGKSDRGSHYNSATTASDSTYQYYVNAFQNTWDVVVVQDYQESVVDGAKFATGMNDFVAWIRTEVPGADIAWNADWVNYKSTYNTYENSIAAINAVNKNVNKPDFIIPASTLIENARTTYLGTTMNQQIHTTIDCAEDLTQYPLLHRDDTHMSKEVGRELASCNFLYTICKHYGLVNSVDAFFGGLKTNPVYYSSENEQWEGDFTSETWDVIKAIVKATAEKPYAVTNLSSTYGTDPILSVADAIKKNVNSKIAVPTNITKDTLAKAYTSEAIDSAKGNAAAMITDLKVNCMEAVKGTKEAPVGIDGKYSITAKLTYAYSVKEVTLCEGIIKATAYIDKTGWQKHDGKTYYFGQDGVMQIGWKQIDNIWYYFGVDGAMATNKWVAYGSSWYYFNDDGTMATNQWLLYKNAWYYFGNSGVMASDKWLSYKGKWYYFGADGIMLANKWLSYNGAWYYLGADGIMLANKWLSYKGAWYYFDADGIMVTSDWVLSGGKWYYLNASGVMVTGKQVINGKTYNFNASGVWMSK